MIIGDLNRLTAIGPAAVGPAPGGTNRILVEYQPIGISLLITPWNFPAAMATRKIALAEAQAAAEVKNAAADMASLAVEGVLTARIAGAKTDPLIDASLARLGERFGGR